ncbi:hypothetical protein D9M68_915990 [compost metagenome]
MAGADHHAQAGALGAREVGHARRGQRTEQHHVDAGGIEARLERRLEHVARDAGVLADQHRGTGLGFLEHAADGVCEAQHEIGGDGRLADRAANAVGAEILTGHVVAL